MTTHAPPFAYKQIAVSDAVRHVRLAARHAREATFRLDEGGLQCEALNDIASDTAALVALWAGRAHPVVKAVPHYVSEAAREWRRQGGRSY